MNSTKIVCTAGDVSTIRIFPRTAKGERESVKYIKALYDARKKDPWFYRLPEINRIQRDMKIRSSQLRRKKLKVKLDAALEDRKGLLDMLGDETPPRYFKARNN